VRTETRAGRYVYVLCSSDDDFFAEVAAISIASLRLSDPTAQIAVLVDRQTSTTNSRGLAAIRPMIDEFLAFDCPGQNSFARSRFLKSSMRGLLAGRFFYLDSDTIVMRSPTAIWDVDADVAASPDLSPGGHPYEGIDAQVELRKTLGWDLSSQFYLNAGAIYFADREASFAVGKQFQKSWSDYSQITGSYSDQLAFNHAIHATEARLLVLPGAYNAQISMNASALRGAVIVHFFTHNFENSNETICHTLAKTLKRTGILDLTALKNAIQNGNPWTKIDSYRKALAARRYASVGRVAFDRLVKKGSASLENALK
jgi:lipopolysaccharide biosynthesis glycosyltransferase